MASFRGPAPYLELGSGIGNFTPGAGRLIRADIQAFPGVQVVADAHTLPFAGESFGTLFMIDVLHHLQNPVGFFREAARVSQPKGRLVLLEPAITPVSFWFYRFFHDEAVDFSWDPIQPVPAEKSRDPGQGNQAIPTILFRNRASELVKLLPDWHLIVREWVGLAGYPLSGGFRPWSCINVALARILGCLEKKLARRFGPWMAFRLLAVLEKR